MLKNYYRITKPGIIYGNVITASGGYFLAISICPFDLLTYLFMLLGMASIIGSGCIINNFIDSDIDQLMDRTKNRPTALGIISLEVGLIYSFTLLIVGLILLYIFTNTLTTSIALSGWFVYVVLYSLWLKRHSNLGTLIGAISGSVPPVVGFCAASNQFNSGAIILFLILFFWQLPHFYAISIFRLDDYANARIPVLPIKHGIYYTKIVMLVYIILFLITALLPSIFGYTGIVYFMVAFAISIYWLILSIKGFSVDSDTKWARKMFFISILAILLLCFFMIIKY